MQRRPTDIQNACRERRRRALTYALVTPHPRASDFNLGESRGTQDHNTEDPHGALRDTRTFDRHPAPLEALIVSLETRNAEIDARLQSQVKKHAKATALITSLQCEIKELREKQQRVVNLAIQFAGNGCERHRILYDAWGFPSSLRRIPQHAPGVCRNRYRHSRRSERSCGNNLSSSPA